MEQKIINNTQQQKIKLDKLKNERILKQKDKQDTVIRIQRIQE